MRSAPMVLGGLYSLSQFSFVNAQEAVNTTWWLNNAQTGGVVTEGEVVDRMETVFGALMKIIISTPALYVGSRLAYHPLTGPRPATSASIISQGSGSGGSQCLPTNVCGIITFRTAFIGKGYRGRMYLPFPAATDLAGLAAPIPSAAYITAAVTLAQAYVSGEVVTGASGGTATMQLVLRHTSRKVGTVPLPTQIITADVPAAWGQLHKRGSYGRENAQPVP